MFSFLKRLLTRRPPLRPRAFTAEPLEGRMLLTRLAVIGDFSSDQQTQPTADVATLVKSWNPDAVVTDGDNNYPDGAASTIDGNIGQYYHQFIYPYNGSYGAGSADAQNHFFPTLGNHDYTSSGNPNPYLNYFTLPNNERYYTAQIGNIALFVVNSESQEPDGISSTGTQATWIKNQMLTSTAAWKIVVFHEPFYSSGGLTNSSMNWPFKSWGATAVISGHDHQYERLSENSLTYFIDGLGGESIDPFNSTVGGSQLRYNDDYGAMRIDSTATTITFSFITRAGATIDSYTINNGFSYIASGATWKYLDDGSNQGTAWRGTSFSDASWSSGASELGYGDGDEATVVGYGPDASNKYVTTYFRKGFSVTDRNAVQALTLNLVRDDGAVVYLNGTEVYRNNMPAGTITYTTLASSNVNEPDESFWYSSAIDPALLNNGNNVIAVEIHQSVVTSSDISFNLQLFATLGAPSAPTALQATAGVGQVSLNWAAATGATTYNVYRGTIAGGESATPVATNVAATSFVNTGLTPGATYYYKVTAVNASGESGKSNEASAVPTSGSVPAAPSGLGASASSPAQIDLAWTNNAANQTGFEIDRSGDGITFSLLANIAGNLLAYSDTGLTPGVTWYYQVRATNAAGASAPSNTANAATPKASPVFSGLAASAAVTYGTATTTVSGTIAAPGGLIPTGNVSVTINGASVNAAINAATGAFSAAFDTHAIPASATAYAITYAYAGGASFNAASDASRTLTVNKRTLTVTASGVNKVYDGATTATVTLSDNRVNADALTVAYTAAAFADKNVGAAKAVSVTGISVTGAAAGDYTLAANTAATTANITTRSLVVTATGINKVYDGTTAATVTLTDNRVAGDVLTIAYTTATFANKTVGTGKTISVGGINISGTDAGNYTPNATATTTANIGARSLTVTATGVNKTYDGTAAASVTLADNRVAGDALTDAYTTAAFADKNVGAGKAVNVTGITVTGADAGNYTLANTTASATANITPRALTVTATGTNKVYDGNATATVTLADNRIAGDAITTSSAAASFADKNVGVAKPVAVTGIAITGADASNYGLTATTAATTATITARPLAVTATGVNKVYDRTTAATVTLSDNRLAGDAFTATYAAATFADKNAGNGKPVGVTGISVFGADAANYTANSTASTAANITARSLTVTAAGINRVYDGTTAATVTLADNRVAGDALTATYVAAAFADKNVGNGKPVSVTGISISGADAPNYSANSTTSATANITTRPLTVTATGANKVYDGTTAATVTLADNRVAGDALTSAYATANFADKNVGTGKSVSVTGINVTGADAGNYTLAGATASTTANITARSLTVTASAVNKTYDGTTAATVTLGDNRVAGDVLTPDYAAAVFATKGVGAGKVVNVTGITLSGADAGNYTPASASASTTANITARSLAVTAVGVNKVYDGTTGATVTLADNRVAGDALSAAYSGATFADKNVGSAKPVAVTGITVTGADAANYTFNTTASAAANITPRALLVTVTGVDKVYDGATAATVTLSDNRIAGDVLTTAYGAATFADRNAGTGKAVSVTGINVTGADAGNYAANATASTTANVTARTLTVTATGINRVYDGTTAATVTLAENRLAGDALTVNYGAAAFADKNVGGAKPVAVTGITVTGADAANYSFSTTASTTANVSARPLTVTATAANKFYDGTTAATVTLADDHLPGDVVTTAYAAANFADKNVGSGKPVGVTGISLAGADASNYAPTSTAAATTADITARTLVITAWGVNKVYDGTPIAPVTLSDNRVAGDTLTVTIASSLFADKNVGVAKPVSVTGIAIAGPDAGNYSVNPAASASATITPRALTVTASGVNRVYDRTTAATVTLADDRIAGDVFADSYASAAFADKNVGSAKPVTVSQISISGIDAGNYTANASASATADITPRALSVTATAAAKSYDGTTAASVTLADNRVAGDAISLSFASASFADKNAGANKTVTVSGIAVAGPDAANYDLPDVVPALSTAADIMPRALNVSATAANKVYDGTINAVVVVNDDHLPGDDVSASFAGAVFADKNVGTGKTVTISGLALAGADAGNYSASNAIATAAADITPLTVSGSVTVSSKSYDGTAAATVLTRSLAGALAGDAVSLAGGAAAFGDKNVGTGKAVTVTGLTLAGADAGNYALATAAAITTADVTPELLVPCTTGNDAVTLVRDPGGLHVNWFLNGTAAFGQLLAADLAGLTIVSNGGSDHVTLDFANGSPLPARLHLPAGTFTVSGLSGTSPLAGTTLDVGRSTVYLAYADAASDPFAAVKAALQAGYANGTWAGTPVGSVGVIISADARDNPLHTTAVGYADFGDGTGVNATPGTVLLKYAAVGDVDLTGTVGLSDYTAVVRNFGTGTDWTQGAVTYGAVISLSDYTAVVRNFGTTVPEPAAAPAASATSSAPLEPSTSSPAFAPATSTGTTTGPTSNDPAVRNVTVTKKAKSATNAALEELAHDRRGAAAAKHASHSRLHRR